MLLLILIILLLFLLPVFPCPTSASRRFWGYVGRGYGWYPSIGLIILIIVILLLFRAV